MAQVLKLRKKIDTSIPLVGLVLSVFGLVMILSSSQISAGETYGSSYYFFIRQLFAWVLGAAAFYYFLKIPIETLYENRVNLLWATLIMLVLVFFPFIGAKANGAYRWIDLKVLRFQPAEVAKLFLTVYFAGWLASKSKAIIEPAKTLIPFIAVILIVALIILFQRDLGTATIIIATALVMFFTAKANLWQFGALVVLLVSLLLVAVYAAPYRAQRLSGFLNKQDTTHESAYQGQQALIAIGSGGIWGVGFGQGISKYSYLPESHTDSIFAVIAEELGFIRTSLVLLLFLYLGYRGLLIARHANSTFVVLLAVGITFMILFQAMVNIAGMLNVIPLTGVPLPYISYGGSSLIVSMAMLGLLTNISRETQ